jgi:hypothetical protein
MNTMDDHGVMCCTQPEEGRSQAVAGQRPRFGDVIAAAVCV